MDIYIDDTHWVSGEGVGDGVAIETVLFQVWSVRMIKSSNELSHPTYLMPFEFQNGSLHERSRANKRVIILICKINK